MTLNCLECKYHEYIDGTHFCNSRNHKRKTVRISDTEAKKKMQCLWADDDKGGDAE